MTVPEQPDGEGGNSSRVGWSGQVPLAGSTDQITAIPLFEHVFEGAVGGPPELSRQAYETEREVAHLPDCVTGPPAAGR